MRDITPYQEPTPQPDRPPIVRPPKQHQGRRAWFAVGLVALLLVATLAATVGTISATMRGIARDQFAASSSFSGLAEAVADAYHKLLGTAGGSLQVIGLGKDALALVPSLLKGERGGDFLALLDQANKQLTSLGTESLIAGIGGQARDLGTAAGALRTWLSATEERRIAIVLGNSAEMRAGGGFIGSYVEVVLRGGAVTGMTVRDINEADTPSLDKTIPPAPLEAIASRWRAADANWFLSGPESGFVFLDLLNRSPLYKEKPVTAVAFVAPRVISDLLQITGPLTAGGIEVNAANFLSQIQAEVQEGQAKGDAAPKAVLAALVPVATEQVIAQAAKSPLALWDAIQGGFARRDIMVYAQDANLQRAIETLGLAGSLYPTGKDFMGTYVAVAPSTIGGDKTDAVTDEAIHMREQLLGNGLVETEVAIDRTHRGKASDPWWYREEHRSYVKVYAPLGATPTGVSGIWLRDRAKQTYDASFKAHPALQGPTGTLRRYDDVKGVESFEETGKQVFGFWQRTAPGQGTVATITYARQLMRPLRDGDTYTCALERQPASTATYTAEIYAPPGFMFMETGTNRWTWESSDPQGQTIITLHLRATNS